MNKVLIIGAGGGIAQAIVKHLLRSNDNIKVTGVSRRKTEIAAPRYHHTVIPDYTDDQISHYCKKTSDQSLDLVICTLGVLHNQQNSDTNNPEINPEKKIEDLTTEQLAQYFLVNTITPAIWLKHLVTKIRLKSPTNIVLFSARVGSIADNRLGGWYGYRASKAALNMMVKTAQVEYQRRVPGCELILYHPGTVDTDLSKPFQRNVSKDKLFSPEFTVTQLFDVLKNKPKSPPPHYLDWNNQTIVW